MGPLDVIAVYSNPIRWTRRLELHRQFEAQMLATKGVRLTTVECAYGERPWELAETPGINRVRVRQFSMVWNKENCQNQALARLPEDAKYICTADADISWRKPEWAQETVQALQLYDVVQPWSHCYDLGPNDDHLEPVHHAFLKEWWGGNPMTQGINAKDSPYRFGHCGFAWAWRRQALEWLGGFIDTAILGAGDHHMALALIGKAWTSLPGYISNGYAAPIYTWEKRALHHINFKLGFVHGTIEHAWHGRKEDRKYVDRWEIIKKHKFDPNVDLKRNTFGMWELVGNKPQLNRDLDAYFRQRNEDSNSLT